MTRQPEDHCIQLDGRRVFLRTVSAGVDAAGKPPLLLIHGISCCTGTWTPFVEELARRNDGPALIVPDLPAHGESAPPPRVLGITEFADWLEWLLRDLEAGAVDVMGHSMGCQVALALADQYPARVRRLVLLGPTTGGRHVSTPRNFAGLIADSRLESKPYNALLTRMFWRMGPLHYVLTARKMQRDDAHLHAARVAAPTLVLQGERDAIIPRRAATDLARVLPTSEYAPVPGAHAAQYSHPAPTADRVLDFLRRG